MQSWTRQVDYFFDFRSRRDWSEPYILGIKFPVIRHFSSSLQNAYSSAELNGLLYYQNSIFFQRQGGEAPLNPWPGALPLDPTGSLPPDSALAMSSHCLQEIAATAWQQLRYIDFLHFN